MVFRPVVWDGLGDIDSSCTREHDVLDSCLFRRIDEGYTLQNLLLLGHVAVRHQECAIYTFESVGQALLVEEVSLDGFCALLDQLLSGWRVWVTSDEAELEVGMVCALPLEEVLSGFTALFTGGANDEESGKHADLKVKGENDGGIGLLHL
jgi:hypothetical protein